MKNIKKIKIKLNGKDKQIAENYKIDKLIDDLKIPIKKVAIELNQEILDKKSCIKLNSKKMTKLKLFTLLEEVKKE